MLLGTPAPHSCTPAPHTCSWPDHHSLCLETLRNHFILPFIPFHVSHPGLLGHPSRPTLIPKGLAGQRSKSPTTHSGIAQCAALSSPHSYHRRNTCVCVYGWVDAHVCVCAHLYVRVRGVGVRLQTRGQGSLSAMFHSARTSSAYQCLARSRCRVCAQWWTDDFSMIKKQTNATINLPKSSPSSRISLGQTLRSTICWTKREKMGNIFHFF